MYTRKFTKTLIMVLHVILFLGLVSCTPHVAPTYTPQPLRTRRWGIQYPTPDEVVPTYTPQPLPTRQGIPTSTPEVVPTLPPLLTPCSPNIEQDISYWKEFVVHDYGFSCKYPPGWDFQREGENWISVSYSPLNIILGIEIKKTSENIRIGAPGTAAGDIIERGSVCFLNREVSRFELVFENETRAVFYGRFSVNDLEFAVRLNDFDQTQASFDDWFIPQDIQYQVDLIMESCKLRKE